MKKNDKQKENKDLEIIENQLKRALADYQNLEKRVSLEKSEWLVPLRGSC